MAVLKMVLDLRTQFVAERLETSPQMQWNHESHAHIRSCSSCSAYMICLADAVHQHSGECWKAFCCPLVSVPLSLAHVDGVMNKTDKSKLMHMLEAFVSSTPPDTIDVTFVYAMYLLHILNNLPSAFPVSSMILRQLCAMLPRVDVVWHISFHHGHRTKETDVEQRIFSFANKILSRTARNTGNVLYYHQRFRLYCHMSSSWMVT